MNARNICSILIVGMCALTAQPAFAADPAALLNEAKSVAWSIRGHDDEMTVRVSPARQSLSIFGSPGNVVGKGIDLIANDIHEKKIDELLASYDPGGVFAQRIEEALREHLSGTLTSVPYLGSTAKYSSKNEAQAARFEALWAEGHQALFDIKVAYGLFGVEGRLVAKLDGKLYALKNGRRVWSETIVVIAEPILGTHKLKDPIKQLLPNVTSPRLTAKGGAIEQWVEGDGKELKARYEDAVDGTIRGVLSSLDLTEDPVGEYYLGKMALYKKKFERAEAHFMESIEFQPASPDARNGLLVTLGHDKRADEALAVAHSLADAHPDYGPVWLNIAWLYAVKKKDGASAVGPYKKALALGMAPSKRIEKRLEPEDWASVAN